jgi:glycosyltransferase involved in cell wall biosynthesis
MKANISSIPKNELIGVLGRLQLPVSVMLERELLKKCDLITTVAKSVAEELNEYEIEPTSVQVLGNGVNTQIFQPRYDREVSGGSRYFLTTGRVGPRKGLADLLECARIVLEQRNDVEFWIAGSGSYQSQLKQRAISLGIDQNIRFLGHISERQEMVRLYQDSLGYIHPAHYEGLPTALLEAMACGCPVVATAVSGALDVIEDGVNGFLAPPRNPEVLAERALFIIDNPDLCSQIGKAAADTIQRNYSWSKVAKEYQNLYEALLDRETL